MGALQRRWRAAPGCLVAGALTLVSACSSADAGNALPIGDDPGEPVTETFNPPEVVPPPNVPTALVIDSGFDLSNPGLRERIAGAFHEVCDPAPSRALGTFEEEKKAALARLAVSDRSCHLEPGVTLVRSAWLDALVPERETWNNRVKAGVVSDNPRDTRIWRALYGDSTYQYHGTLVLGVLAFQAPNVRFVVVEKQLLPPGQKQEPCPEAGSIRLWTRLLVDDEYQRAFVAQPASRLSEDYSALAKRLHVHYTNASYGYAARAERERSCAGHPWAAYYAAWGALRARVIAAADPKLSPPAETLTAVSAGNQSTKVSTAADAITCSANMTPAPSAATLVVGASATHTDVIASFSNFGACVDVHAPGEYVLSTTAHGFLLPFSGTSAAAPITLRHAILRYPALPPVEARKAVLADATGVILPSRLFPAELLWPPSGTASGSSALTLAEREETRTTRHTRLRREWDQRLPHELLR